MFVVALPLGPLGWSPKKWGPGPPAVAETRCAPLAFWAQELREQEVERDFNRGWKKQKLQNRGGAKKEKRKAAALLASLNRSKIFKQHTPKAPAILGLALVLFAGTGVAHKDGVPFPPHEAEEGVLRAPNEPTNRRAIQLRTCWTPKFVGRNKINRFDSGPYRVFFESDPAVSNDLDQRDMRRRLLSFCDQEETKMLDPTLLGGPNT